MLDRPGPVLVLVVAAAGFGVAASHGAGPAGDAPAASPGDEAGAAEAADAGGHGDGHDHGEPDPGDGPPGHPYANRHLLRDWPEAQGTVPTRREAEGSFDRFERIEITSNEDFNPANGVVAGNGTADNPWVIEEVLVEEDLYVADTSEHVVIRESYVDGQLTLNWVGDRVHVHHNHIDDLRVNENVRRTGEDTTGLIEENRVEYVGQIRHYDGVFRWNTVGPDRENATRDPAATLGAREKAVQLDGMHGGDFHGNDFTGWVEIKLHGHHHASCWTCLRHHHANETTAEPWDHTVRYHRMSFHDNEIQVPRGPALRYTDTAHAADDQSAASEDVEALDLPHRHHTRVYLWNNTLLGGGLDVDVFNAESDDHPDPNPGRLVVEGNTVEPDADGDQLEAGEGGARTGIHVNRARWLNLTVADNTVRFDGDSDPLRPDRSRGILLDGFRSSNVTVEGNRVVGAWHGVEAEDLPGDVHWTVRGNAFADVDKEVYWDSSVENPPERS